MGDPVETIHHLRRFCFALGRPPAHFTLSYDMDLDCRRRCRMITALPLSFMVELCNIGVRVGLSIRVAGGMGGVGRKWQLKVASLRKDVSLTTLTELCISGQSTAAQVVMVWLSRCGMPRLNRLTYVALRSSSYTPILISHFGGLPMLTSLSLAQNALSGRSLRALQKLTGLAALDISANPLYPDEMSDLASVLDSLQQLTELNMSSDYLRNGLAVVAPSIPKSVTWLDLSSNELCLESLTGLILPSITWLNLSSNALGAYGAGMVQVTSLTNLVTLDLRNNGVLDESPSWEPAVPWLTHVGSRVCLV
jgi:hypothetical protein